jgi:hypothetical protein
MSANYVREHKIEPKCCICGNTDPKTHMVVTLKMQQACWTCVTEAVDYYREAMKEEV